MKENYIGKQIEVLRKKRKIKQEDLCFGLCEQPVLSRIESGAVIPNYFLEVTLLSRLGYSSNKMEFILEEKDYEYFLDRNRIEQAIKVRNYGRASSLLNEFEKKLTSAEKLHLQFLLFCRARITCDRGELELALEYATQALKQTIPKYFLTNPRPEIPLSTIETELITKIVQLSYQLKRNQSLDLEEILRKLFLQEEELIEEEEKIIIFSSIAVQYATILLEKKKFQQAVEVCEKGIGVLRRNARLFNYADLLLLKIQALKKLNLNMELYKETFFMAYSMLALDEERKNDQQQLKNYMEECGWEFII